MLPSYLNSVPRASQGTSAPNFHSIPNWNQWISQVGLGQHMNLVEQYAREKGLSREDAAYQVYYSQPQGQMGPSPGDLASNPGLTNPVTQSGASGATAGGTGGLNDIISAAKELTKFQTEQNKPVIASLEAQRDPIKQRYAALLDQIKGNQKTAEQRESTAAAREFGRRGIPLSSGLYDETITERLNPITQQYTNLYAQTGAGQESDLLTLARQIAELQSGAPGQALSQAFQFGNYQQGAQQLASQIASQQAQQQIARQQLALSQKESGLAERKFNEYDLPYLSYLKSGGSAGANKSGWSVVRFNS